MVQMQRVAFHSISYLLLETTDPKRKGGASSGLTLSAFKRAKWDPTPNSSNCSTHFAKEDFAGIFSIRSGKRPRLTTDETGIVPIPEYTADDKPLSARAKRMVCKQLI